MNTANNTKTPAELAEILLDRKTLADVKRYGATYFNWGFIVRQRIGANFLPENFNHETFSADVRYLLDKGKTLRAALTLALK